MEKCSYFIEDKALFGSFPCQETVNFLENIGVRLFVDLTGMDEYMITPYTTKYKYINYPIIDRKIPTDWKNFSQLILIISEIIDDLKYGEKIYIHCKGGHGRSGILVASLLCYRLKITPEESLELTSLYHSRRPVMRDKWRILGSPQGKSQKDFIRRFFRPLKFSKPEMIGYTAGFHLMTEHQVYIKGVGTFKNSYKAVQYYRNPEMLESGDYTEDEYKINENINWDENKEKYVENILTLKFIQNPELKENLLNTGLRDIIKYSHDHYWGNGITGTGKNLQGIILCNIRKKLLLEDFIDNINIEN